MMPNVTRGDRMPGLVSYLVGGGRHNEHTEPHLVAGDHALMAWYDDAELSGDNANAIARHLDRPRTAMGVEVKGGHVWHASLSLRAEEGIRTDQEWATIAQDFVTAMEFDDNDGTKAPCRWVADPTRSLAGRQRPHAHRREPRSRGRHEGVDAHGLPACTERCARPRSEVRLGAVGVDEGGACDARLQPRGAVPRRGAFGAHGAAQVRAAHCAHRGRAARMAPPRPEGTPGTHHG